MDRKIIHDFLYRIATVPTYRKKLEEDPVQTLAELGIKLKPEGVPPGGIHLPSNEEILAKLEELIDELEQAGLCGEMIWHNAFIWE